MAGDIDEFDRCSALDEDARRPARPADAALVLPHPADPPGPDRRRHRRGRTSGRRLSRGRHRGGQPDAGTIFAMHLLGANEQRGTADVLIPVIEEIRADMQDIAKAAVESALSSAYLDAGRLEDARPVLVGFAEGGFELPVDSVWLVSMTTYANVAIECGDRRTAGPLFALLEPWWSGCPPTGAARPTDRSVSSLVGSPRPRPLRRGRLVLHPGHGLQPPHEGEVLRRPDRPPVGEDAHGAWCPGGQGEGTRPPDERPFLGEGPRLRRRRATVRGCTPGARLTVRAGQRPRS